MLFTVIMLMILVVVLMVQNMNLSFKKGYYERTIENNWDKFTPDRYKHFKKVKDSAFAAFKNFDKS